MVIILFHYSIIIVSKVSLQLRPLHTLHLDTIAPLGGGPPRIFTSTRSAFIRNRLFYLVGVFILFLAICSRIYVLPNDIRTAAVPGYCHAMPLPSKRCAYANEAIDDSQDEDGAGDDDEGWLSQQMRCCHLTE